MPVQRSILVFEYLLADPTAWKSAAESMRHEAAAMLTAIVEDIAALGDVCPMVLMSSAAADAFCSSGRLASRTQIVVSDSGPSVWLQAPSCDPSVFDATLVIAPESGLVLASLLRQLQSGAWQQTRSLNVSWTMAEMFSDKYQTCRWLQEQKISTPPTKTLSQAGADRLCASSLSVCEDGTDGLPNSWELGILKPRDGVGSDAIFLVSMDDAQFSGWPISCSIDDRWVLQPFLPGIACSVGLIGGGSLHPTLILPAGQQQILREGRILHYSGGLIPCSAQLMPAVMEVSRRLVAAIGAFSGYVGADVVVTCDDQNAFVAHVIEINPRLCTSYAGYRAIAERNLADAILQRSADQSVGWKPVQVQFDSAGNVTEMR